MAETEEEIIEEIAELALKLKEMLEKRKELLEGFRPGVLSVADTLTEVNWYWGGVREGSTNS